MSQKFTTFAVGLQLGMLVVIITVNKSLYFGP